jgi:hypothetical protein
MNVVLYTKDFEPITVLDLPTWLLDQLEKVGAIRVAVQDPVKIDIRKDEAWSEPMMVPQLKIVTIYCERLRWKDGTTKPVLITHDEELALTLKPEWLPGQRQRVQSYEKAIRTLTETLVKAMRK